MMTKMTRTSCNDVLGSRYNNASNSSRQIALGYQTWPSPRLSYLTRLESDENLKDHLFEPVALEPSGDRC